MSLRFKFVLVVLLVLTVVSIALIRAVGGALDAAKESTGQRAKQLTERGLEASVDEHFAKVVPGLLETWVDHSLQDYQRQQASEIRRELSKGESAFEELRLYRRRGEQVEVSDLRPDAAFGPISDEDALAQIDLAMVIEEGKQIAQSGDRVLYRLNSPSADQAELLLGAQLRLPPFILPEIQSADVDVSSLRNAVAWPLVIGGLLLLLVLLVALWLFVVSPLRTLDEASRRISQGDYSREVPRRLSGDEMSRLITTFNTMQREVRRYQDEMEARIEDAREEISRKERTLVVAQRLAATGTLAAGLAHEINNPLGGMKNAVRRLQKTVEGERHGEYLEMIEEGLQRVETLMGQILDFSRRRDNQPEHFDFCDVARRSLAFVKHRFDERFKLLDNIPAGTLEGFGMPSAIQQVIINLLINARDACDECESAEIKIALRDVEDGVELVISDTGKGMDDETVERIFDPFYTTKEPGKGTGLGLSIIHNIVQNHDGYIAVESKIGEGTTFTAHFPKDREASAVEKLLEDQPPAASSKSSS